MKREKDSLPTELLWTLIAIAVVTVLIVIAWSASSAMVMVGAILMALVVLGLVGLIWWMDRFKNGGGNASA